MDPWTSERLGALLYIQSLYIQLYVQLYIHNICIYNVRSEGPDPSPKESVNSRGLAETLNQVVVFIHLCVLYYNLTKKDYKLYIELEDRLIQLYYVLY